MVQLGLNRFADMTEAEFRAAYLGYSSRRNPLMTCAAPFSLAFSCVRPAKLVCCAAEHTRLHGPSIKAFIEALSVTMGERQESVHPALPLLPRQSM